MYTRRGDKGDTSLFGPRRVGKDSPRVDAYGTVDELCSVLGVVVSDCRDRAIASDLQRVQRMLFVAGADLASDDLSSAKVPRITPEDTLTIEKMTDALLKSLPPLGNFLLPGGTRVAAELHVARAVCRRSERAVVALSRKEQINQDLLPFFNRLSSYLFNLSRLANKKAGRREQFWSGES
jgi:cob(I)alamin adenosyltransferase